MPTQGISSPGESQHMDDRQREAPYLDALVEYAERGPARLHVPGHKGGQGADEGCCGRSASEP